MENFKDFDSIYQKIQRKVFENLRNKYVAQVIDNPLLLLDFLKEIRVINLPHSSQSFIYHLAKLSLEGCMPLIEEDCKWVGKSGFWNEKPIFVVPKEDCPESYQKDYENNPFLFRSDMLNFDGAFEVFVTYGYSTNFKKRDNKNFFDITIISDKDFEGHQHYKNNPLYIDQGKAYFVFRVETENNDENVIKVLSKLKNTIINRKVEQELNSFTEKFSEDIADSLTQKVFDFIN